MTMTEAEVLKLALAAYDDAARAQYEREGSRDCGACGGAMVGYSGNTRFAKAMQAAGVGFRTDGKVYLHSRLPEGVSTQSANVFQAGARAFRELAERWGHKPSKYWTYID
jgi:hypothetical protein